MSYPDFAPHTMSNNTTPAPYVASASSQYSASYAAWHAFDASLTLPWGTQWGQTTGWLKIDIGAQWSLDNYSVQGEDPGEGMQFAPKNWTLEGSNNDADWTTLDTVTNQTGWSGNEIRNFDCDLKNQKFRYFRLNVSLANGGNMVEVGGLYLYGYQMQIPLNYLKDHGRGRSRLNLDPISA